MIAIGSDHGGYKLKEEIKKYLEEKEIEYIDCGTFDEESVDYPEIAKAIALEVQGKECDKGIAICRSGIGMSIVANKFKGIRCAKCNDEEEAKYSRMHNDANILALGADYIETSEAIRIVRMWIATEFEGGRHEERIKLINEIEKENRNIELMIENILLATDKSKVTVYDSNITLNKKYKISARPNKKDKLIQYIKEYDLPIATWLKYEYDREDLIRYLKSSEYNESHHSLTKEIESFVTLKEERSISINKINDTNIL